MSRSPPCGIRTFVNRKMQVLCSRELNITFRTAVRGCENSRYPEASQQARACYPSYNNKIEIDAGMVTLRQPLEHERRPARSNGCRKSGKEGYGDPSGEATWGDDARQRTSKLHRQLSCHDSYRYVSGDTVQGRVSLRSSPATPVYTSEHRPIAALGNPSRVGAESRRFPT